MIELIIGVLILLTLIKIRVMYYFAKKSLKSTVEYIPIRNRCNYHHSPSGDICMNCGKLVTEPPGEYIDGYQMVITKTDGTKEGWIVDQNGK